MLSSRYAHSGEYEKVDYDEDDFEYSPYYKFMDADDVSSEYGSYHYYDYGYIPAPGQYGYNYLYGFYGGSPPPYEGNGGYDYPDSNQTDSTQTVSVGYGEFVSTKPDPKQGIHYCL